MQAAEPLAIVPFVAEAATAMPSASPYVLPGQAHIVVDGRLLVGIAERAVAGQPGYTVLLLLEDGVVGVSSSWAKIRSFDHKLCRTKLLSHCGIASCETLGRSRSNRLMAIRIRAYRGCQ